MNRNHNESVKKHNMSTEKYELTKIIGEGAYGTVFKAICTKTKKPVAIKFINLKDVSYNALKLICREVKINQSLSSIKHNIFTPMLLEVFIPPKDRDAEKH